MLSFTCHRGGQTIMALTRQELAFKLHEHRRWRHGLRPLILCRPPVSLPPPLLRAYQHTSAMGTTRGGY